MTIQGGQTGTAIGKNNRKSERSFNARHDATGMTPKNTSINFDGIIKLR